MTVTATVAHNDCTLRGTPVRVLLVHVDVGGGLLQHERHLRRIRNEDLVHFAVAFLLIDGAAINAPPQSLCAQLEVVVQPLERRLHAGCIPLAHGFVNHLVLEVELFARLLRREMKTALLCCPRLAQEDWAVSGCGPLTESQGTTGTIPRVPRNA